MKLAAPGVVMKKEIIANWKDRVQTFKKRVPRKRRTKDDNDDYLQNKLIGDT